MNYNAKQERGSSPVNLEGRIYMPTKLKRLTFVLTPEMEPLLDGIKKEMFYNCSQSEMIRTLVGAGLNAIKNDNQRNPTKQLV